MKFVKTWRSVLYKQNKNKTKIFTTTLRLTDIQTLNPTVVPLLQSSRRGKHSFELHMQDKSFYVFAADNEAEMEEWVGTLKKVIQSNDVTASPHSDRISRGRARSQHL